MFFYCKTVIVNSIEVALTHLQKRKRSTGFSQNLYLNTNGTNELHKYSQALRSKIKKLHVSVQLLYLC